MFCEYLETGRCQQLEGTNGAYNKYEEELIGNTIIGKIDKIYDSLESIKDNQYLLYSGIKSVEASIDSLSSTVCNNIEALAQNIDAGIDTITDRSKEKDALNTFNAQFLSNRLNALQTVSEHQLHLMRLQTGEFWA